MKEVNTNFTATIDVDWEFAIRKAYEAKPQPNSPDGAGALRNGGHESESGSTIESKPVESPAKTETVIDVEEVKP